MNVGTLEIQLLANMARLQQDMDAAKKTVGGAMAEIERYVSIAKTAFVALAGVASVNAFVGMIKGAIEGVARLKDLAAQTGATVGALSALGSIGKFSDTSLSTISTGLNKLSKNLSTATEESKGTGAALRSMGIDVEAFKRLKPEDQMLALAKAQEQFADGGGKSAAMMAILGKEGATLIPYLKDLAAVGELNGKVTKEQADMADEYSDNLIKIKANGEGWKKQIAMGILPVMTDLSNLWLKMTDGAGGLKAKIKEVSSDGSLEEWARAVVVALSYVADVVHLQINIFPMLGKAIGAQMAAMATGVGAVYDAWIRFQNADLSGAWTALKGGVAGIKTIAKDASNEIADIWNQKLIGQKVREGLKEVQAARVAIKAEAERKQVAFDNSANTGQAQVTDPFAAAYASLGQHVAQLNQATASLDLYQDAAAHAKASEMEFQVTLGKLKDIAPENKDLLRAMAVEADTVAAKNKILAESVKMQADGIKAGQEAATILESGTQAVNVYTQALQDLASGRLKDLSLTEKQNHIGDAYRKMIEEGNRSIATMTDGLRKSTAGVQADIAALLKDGDAAKYNIEQKTRLTLATANGTEEYKKAAIAAAQVADAVNKISDAARMGLEFEDRTKALNAEMILDDRARADAQFQLEVDKWNKQIALAEAAYAQLAALGDEANADKLRAEREALDKSSQALQNYVAKVKDRGDFSDFKKIWDDIDAAAQSAFESIFKGGENAFVKLRDVLKNTIIKMLYDMTVHRWLIDIGASITGTGSAAGAVAGAAGNGVASSLSGGLMSSMSGMSLFGLGTLGELGVGISTAVSGGILTGFTSGLALIGTESTMLGIGLALPFVGIIAGGIALLASIFGDDGPEQNTTLGFASNNAAGNTSINMRGNEGNTTDSYTSYAGTNNQISTKTPFGTYGVYQTLWANQAQLPAYLQNVKTTDTAMAAQMTDEEIARVTDYVSTKTFTAGTGPEGGDTSAGLAFAFEDRIKTVFEGLETGLSSLIDGFEGNSAQLAQEAVTLLAMRKHIDDYSAAIGETVTLQSMAKLKKDGETASQAIARLGMEFNLTNKFAEGLGMNSKTAFGATGLASAEMREKLIEAAGGLAKFGELSQFYSENFRTVAENSVSGFKGLDDSLKKFGLSSNSSREDFDKVMKGMDLSTPAGAALAAELLKIAPAFVSVTDALKTANTTIEAAFMNPAEKQAKVTKDMEDGFAALGIAAPHTREELRALYDSLNDGSATSNAMRLAISKLIPGFEAYISGVNASAAATTAAAEAAAAAAERTRKSREQTTQTLNEALAPFKPHPQTLAYYQNNENQASMSMLQGTGISSWEEVLSLTPEQIAGLTDKQRGLITEYANARQATEEYRAAVKQNTQSYHEAVMRMNGASDAQVNAWKSSNIMAQITALTPGLTSVSQALSLTDEQFAALPLSTQNLILQLFPLQGSLNATAEAAANAAQQIYEAEQSIASQQIDFDIKAFQTKMGLIADSIKDLAGTDYGKELSLTASYMQTLLASEQQKLAALTAQGHNAGYADWYAAAANISVAQQTIAQLGQDLARYTVLEAQYAGHGKELLDLEKWRDQQRKLAYGNSAALLIIEQDYAKKREAIINGTLSTGLDNTGETLRKWLQSLDQNASLSPLTAQQQRDVAYAAYMQDLAKANAGDKAAKAALTKDAEALLAAQKAVSGFGGDYSAIFAMIKQNIGDLANFVDPAGAPAPVVVSPDSFNRTNDAIADTTAAVRESAHMIGALRQELADTKATLARLLEQGNGAVKTQTTQIVASTNDASGKTIGAIKRHTEITAKA